MKTHTTRLKILAVGPIQTSATVKQTTRKVVLGVAELAKENTFGHSLKESNRFDVEVYNHNIENFQIGTNLVGEIADCELDIRFYQRDSGLHPEPKFIVSDMIFRL